MILDMCQHVAMPCYVLLSSQWFGGWACWLMDHVITHHGCGVSPINLLIIIRMGG